MRNIDSLEFGRGGPLTIVHLDQSIRLTDPRSKNYQWVLHALEVRHLPELPVGMPVWKRDLAFDRWVANWNLPSFQDAHRLCYLIDNYRSSITTDLQFIAGLDLGDLWRDRQWRRLVDLIDRLPSHSWYASAVASDEKHAQMLAESMEGKQDDEAAKEDQGPALTTWTPEVAIMTDVLDAVRRVEHSVYASRHGKKVGDPPAASPRPKTAISKAMKRAEFDRKRKAHEALAARVLPHKRQSQDPVH